MPAFNDERLLKGSYNKFISVSRLAGIKDWLLVLEGIVGNHQSLMAVKFLTKI